MPAITARILGRTSACLALVTLGLMAGHSPASALIHTCTNNEIRTIVTDAFIISCTGVGGTVKCTDSGKQTCCKKVDGYQICSPNPSNLEGVRNPPPSRPPRAWTDAPPDRVNPPYTPRPPRIDPSPDRVGPSHNPRPPRADPPPSRVNSPASSGPVVKRGNR